MLNVYFSNANICKALKELIRTEVNNTILGVPRYKTNADTYIADRYELPCGKYVTNIIFRNSLRDIYCTVEV